MKVSQLPAASWVSILCGPGARTFYSAVKPVEESVLIPDIEVATAEQIHSNGIAEVTESIDMMPGADALITSVPHLAVAVRTADCVPVMVNASDIGAVAAIHAGWRGTIKQIVRLTVEQMMAAGASPKSIYAAIGPHICGACYEVSRELAAQFVDAGYEKHVDTDYPGNPHLDLGGINKAQLLQCGVPESQIFEVNKCTLCERGEVFPSYRRNATSQRLYTLIYRKSV